MTKTSKLKVPTSETFNESSDVAGSGLRTLLQSSYQRGRGDAYRQNKLAELATRHNDSTETVSPIVT